MTSEALSAVPPRPVTSSELPGFYRLSASERVARLIERLGLDGLRDLRAGLDMERADRMVENAIGVLGVPLGVCVNLRVDGRDYLVPMAIEEPSVIAAASGAAKLLRSGAGLVTEVAPPLMEGQIQLLDVADPERAKHAIESARTHLLELANKRHPRLVSAGGGARDISVRILEPCGEDDPLPPMFIVQLVVDVGDAMGANLVNSMCEEVAPEVERLANGRVRLRILTNLCQHRTVTVRGTVPLAAFADEDVPRGIVEASVFAERDVHRATTHNKGIMNGIDAVMVAFGQDWRAIEAAAHAWCARSGRYSPLSRWRIRGDQLEGEMTVPLAVGVVGGITKVHPTVRAAFRIAGLTRASTLASVAASVGLAQNLGALRALAAEGIQRGHMRLHARKRLVREGRDQRADLDRSYCETALPRVSRTFALSIEALPQNLRESVRIAYLLCRIVDTVEDEPGIDPKIRSALFDSFDALLMHDDVSPAGFELEWARLFSGRAPSAEVDLARNAGAVFRSFRRLPERSRAVIRPHVLEMSRGMRFYVSRRDEREHLAINDLEDLETYCHFVAGTVGVMLTELFEHEVPHLRADLRYGIRSRAASFGLGLQLVNILKDVAEDVERGACFIPQTVAEAHGVRLDRILEPEERERAMAMMRALAGHARRHLERAMEYTLLWPVPEATAVRMFCAVPLVLALASLREIESGGHTLKRGTAPKISREHVRELFERARCSVDSDHELAKLFGLLC